LKYFHKKNTLFTAKDLEDQGIYLNRIKKSNPQKYYLTDIKSKIIEDYKNVQKGTTGSRHNLTASSFIDQQKIQNFRDILCQLSQAILYIHKLQIWTRIDKKYYAYIKDIKPDPVNGAKVYEQRIGISKGPPNLKFIISPNGTIMIYVSSSMNPFRLYEEQDVSDILIFLGRVSDRLHYLFSDSRDKLIAPVREWILKGCDINKDIPINNMTQLTLPDIQISMAEKAFRGYVKLISSGKAYYRVEQSLAPNEPVNIALDKLRTDTKIDENIFS
jgi:hypothetical protein